MPRQSHILSVPESSNRVRVSPYPLRSSRTTVNYKAPELPSSKSELEDVRCVICMEPPHNAVLLTCSSSLSGCRPYMCDTGARHSNCLKQFHNQNKTKEILGCPLCRGEVLWTAEVPRTAKRFMNAKPRSCPVDDCKFAGTYNQLDKHLRNEHRGLIPPNVEPQRQRRWDQLVRDAEYAELMSAVGIPHRTPHNPEVVRYQRPNIYHPPAFQENIANRTVRSFVGPGHSRNDAFDEGRWRLISYLLSLD